MKKAVIALIVIAILVVSAIITLNYTVFTKENKVKEYLNAYVDRDYNKAFEMLGIEESHFINSKALSLDYSNGLVGIKDYEIKKIKKVDEYTYDVKVKIEYDKDYEEERNPKKEEVTEKFVLKKARTKKYLVFNNWYIQPPKTIDNIEFKLPRNTRLYFDGVEADKSFFSTNGNVDTIRIPELYDQTYKITMDYEFGHTQDIYWNPKSLSRYKMTLDLGTTVEAKIIKTSEELINKIFEGIKTGKSYEELVNSLNYGDHAKKLIDIGDSTFVKSNYEEGIELYKNKTLSLTDLKLSNFSIYKAYITKGGRLQINLVYDFERTYYFDNKPFVGKEEEQIKIYYVYEDGQFKMEEIRDENFRTDYSEDE